jgi:hypothetical protein
MKWIPIEKGLPKNAQDVLICTDKGNVCSGYMVRKRYGEWYLHNQELADELVIAWLLLPAPMKYSKQVVTGAMIGIPYVPQTITITSTGQVDCPLKLATWHAFNGNETIATGTMVTERET